MNKKIIWDDNFFDVPSRGYLDKKTSETQIFTISNVDGKLNLTAYFLDGIHNPITLWNPSFTSVDMVKEHALKVMKLYSNRYYSEDQVSVEEYGEEYVPSQEKIHGGIIVALTISVAVFVGFITFLIASHDKSSD